MSLKGVVGDGGIGHLVALQHHRGPDSAGLWRSPDRMCVLGANRLSIVDLSDAGRQPMIDPITGNVIAYNGEIYNFLQLRRECEERGDTFRSKTDTEVVLAVYRRYGVQCVTHLRGMFAFALWDAGKQQLFVARDRTGEKPLNYALRNGSLVFCSEIYPLASHRAVGVDIDMEALELYLQHQYIPAPWTIYRDIRKLPPAHCAVFGADGFRMWRYWQLDYRKKISLSEEEAADELEQRCREAVRLRMISDVPVGVMLSGGVDSSLVVGMMASVSSSPVRAFTVSLQNQEMDELSYAQQVAQRYGIEHHAQAVQGDLSELLMEMPKYYGEPFADKAMVPAFLISRCARGYVKVALSGDGGDELLGGYRRYALPAFILGVARRFARHSDIRASVTAIPRLQLAENLFARAHRRLVVGLTRPELLSLIYPGFWTDAHREDLLGGNGDRSTRAVERWRSELLGEAYQWADDPVDRMLWVDTHTYLPGDGLVKMDIAAMHCSLEPRTPFVDHELMEFAASLPANFKVRHGIGKYLLKKVAERYVPRQLVYRRKQGFTFPVGVWLRGPLRGLVEEVTGDPRLMEPLNTEVARRVIQEFARGFRQHTYRVWSLLMYGLWRRATPGTTWAGPPVLWQTTASGELGWLKSPVGGKG